MELSKLEFFFAAADARNFTQAAEKCNIAQTTMSKYIAQLEEELGVRLFDRKPRECVLTEAGHLFYSGAKELTADFDSLQKSIRGVSENELRIGIYGDYFDLSVLRDFIKSHPDIKLQMAFDSVETIFHRLYLRRIHAILIPSVLVPASVESSSLKRIDLHTDRPFLYCSRAAIERLGSIDAVIRELPFITKSDDKAYQEQCRNMLREIFGSSFHEVSVVHSSSHQLLLVELSQGFAIMLESEVSNPEDYYSYPLEGIFKESLQLVYDKRHVPDSLTAFIRFIDKNMAKK